MKKANEIQALIRRYREETGEKEVDMRKVAEWAYGLGWPVPTPPDPLDLLAKQFSQAAREETRRDPETGEEYRVNHAFTPDSAGQGVLWVDIDDTSRPVMLKCLVQRREQMVGDAVQLAAIQDHWNRANPNQEPIQLPLDFTLDVEWRKNGGDAQTEAA